jgi:MFS family permease
MAEAPVMSARQLAALCVASVGWAFGFGLGAPLASLWLQDAGASDTVIGLNTGVYYLGLAVASGAVPALMRRWGRGCPLVGVVASGFAVACFPWTQSLGAWFVIRLGNGLAAAISLIPIETFVNRHSPPAQRARNFGFYAVAVACGWALGNFVGLQMYAGAPRLAFGLGGLASVLAAGAVLAVTPWPAEPPREPRARASLGLGRNFLSFGSAWSQGFLEGGMVALLPVYLLFIGLSEGRVGCLTSGIMVGVILFQVPVAWLADHLGRTRVLVLCYAAAAAGLAALPFCGAWAWLAVCLFLVGACSGAFYPLGLAILGERLPAARLARANAWYMAINCCGSLTGPVLTGVAMDRWGKPAMFPVGEAAVLGVIAAWLALGAVYRLRADSGLSGPADVAVREAA